MAELWQKSLRRSTGQTVRPKPLVRKVLKSISEIHDENDPSVGNIIKKTNEPRQRLSTRGSCSEAIPEEKLKQSPTKVAKKVNFLAKLPPPLKHLKPEDNLPKDLPSPIPLPPGVTNIDPEDDGNNPCGRDNINYLIALENKLQVTKENVTKGDIDFQTQRRKLVSWLIHVAHHYKCSQETIYHTIDILDRMLSVKGIRKEYLQLLGVSCYLIATKLDEYYPADLTKLSNLTENAFLPKDILSMETEILVTLNWVVYGVDPMAFINRFIRAAYLVHEKTVYELTIFGMDSLSLNADFWFQKTSKKAAASLLAAMLVFLPLETIDARWTPNLKYYAWPVVEELYPMARYILEYLHVCIRDEDAEHTLTIKYQSVSRHRALLQRIKPDHVLEALNDLDMTEETSDNDVFTDS